MYDSALNTKVADGISPMLAQRLIEYAASRIKQSGYSVAEGSAINVMKNGTTDPRYEVEWTDFRAGQQVAVECIIAYRDQSFMNMGIRKTKLGQRITHL